MFDYLLTAICCVCMLHAGLGDEDCQPTVLARRQTFDVPAGSSLSLSCNVRHCGGNWTGTWLWKNTTDENYSFVKGTARHQLMRATVSVNETRLVLKMLAVNQSDEGSYGCTVTWGFGQTEQGHWVVVNITAASQRVFSHRIYICTAAVLCLPLCILGLAHCLSSKVKHQPLPMAEFTYAAVRRNEPQSVPRPPPRRVVPPKIIFSPHNGFEGAAPLKSQQKAEVVYADISQDSLIQQEATREPAQSTVYSLLKFP